MPNPVTFEFQNLSYQLDNLDKEAFRLIPKSSGVFRVLDLNGNILVLEKTHDLSQRLEPFFSSHNEDSRALDLRKVTGQIDYCTTDSPMETSYLLYLERRRLFPKSYKKMRTFPFFHLLKINRRQRFPRIYATRQIKGGVDYFGPFSTRSELEKLKATLERTFKIRPCRYNIRGDDPYPDCMYFQMKTCSKPCNGDISREVYLNDIDRVIAFIEGKDSSIKDPLLVQIQELSEETRFEEADQIRRQLERFENARKDHRNSYLNLLKFNFVAVMDSGCQRKRKIAFIRAGLIQSVEEYSLEEITENLCDAMCKYFKNHATILDRDRQYDEFCLVSNFITNPIRSVRLTFVEDPKATSAQIIDNLTIEN